MSSEDPETDPASLLLVGFGALGRIAAGIAGAIGRPLAGALDDTREVGSRFEGTAILGGFDRLDDAGLMRGRPTLVCLARGRVRARTMERARAAGATFATLVHPGSEIAAGAEIGDGSLVNGFSVIYPGARCGVGLVLDNHASIGVDCRVAECVFVGPGAHLCRGATVGSGSYIGVGAIVLPGLNIGSRSIVAAGTTVRRDLPDGMTWTGDRAVPSALLRRLRRGR